jgi:glycosyltransferase involved in cell wall biosynthesis
MPRERLTIVIPVLNEEAVLDRLADHLRAVVEGLDLSWEVLFVDDGSTDGSLAKLKDIHAAERRFAQSRSVGTSARKRRFAAGLRYARGDAVIFMDADLQHPPNIIPRFIECWRQGYKVVFGQRQGRDDRFLRRLASRLFYASFRRVARTRLPAGIVDFLLLDRQAVDAINGLGEQTRFSKGLYVWIGFPSTTVPFTSGERESGASRWKPLKLAQFALDGFVSFTSLPLKVSAPLVAYSSGCHDCRVGLTFPKQIV